MIKLLAIVGTNAKVSTNRKLLQFIQERYKSYIELELLEISGLPKVDFSKNIESDDILRELLDKVKLSDGLVIASPEYLHAPSAVLMNFLNWISLEDGLLKNKPCLLINASNGSLGPLKAQDILRDILRSEKLMADVYSEEFLLDRSDKAFDEDGNLNRTEKLNELDNYFSGFIKYVYKAGKI